MRLEDLGLIGNCQISALIERSGAIVWCCLPRFDSEPVFAALLDEQDGGRFAIAPADGAAGEQRYLEHTNVLETRFSGTDGTFRVLDFAPRFRSGERMFRPAQLVRVVEPLAGAPRVVVRCDPRRGWSKASGFAGELQLSSDAGPDALAGRPFALTERKHFVLSWGASPEPPLAALCQRWLDETTRYWRGWVAGCTVPPVYAGEVIRSALVLKLHCFEETGAIAAALTTSIPESAGSGRTWDYRYCWLRDAYYALAAFELLGQTEERAGFVRWLLQLAANAPELALQPLYRIDGGTDLDERILSHWPGFDGDGPVRVGNGAALQAQHDIFGETVLALAPVFLDERFAAQRSPELLERVAKLARRAVALAGTPDAGIWEVRTEPRPQTFSSLMSWAAADRMARIAARHAPALETEFRAAAERIRAEIVARSWNAGLGSFASMYDDVTLDASLLQMVPLGLLAPDDARLHRMMEAIGKGLAHDGWLFRYGQDDGFGTPEVAFVICTFWLVEALALLGKGDEARARMEHAQAALSPLGLLSEDYDTARRRMWGNFPQAYSHVGLIHAAFALARLSAPGTAPAAGR